MKGVLIMFKKLRIAAFIAFVFAIFSPISAKAADMYRVYNPNNGEHFYTGNAAERNRLVGLGWQYEGIGFTAPASGANVYRLYNPSSGGHFYTANLNEKNSLQAVGWNYEGVCWYSGGSIPLYRQNNPNGNGPNSYNYTTSVAENNSLVSVGWRSEGVVWYCTGGAQPVGSSPPATPTPPPASTPSYAATTIYVSGKVIPYKNGGMANGQAIIDSNPPGIASTWGGMTPFSGTDGLNTHFIGHHWGAFDPFINLQVGQTVTITDTSGKAFTYKVRTINVVNTSAVDTTTGRSLYGEITSTGGGERVVFQTCIDETTRRILFCFPQ